MAGKSKTVAYAGVRLVADIGDFKKKMKSASKRVADFSKKTAKFALGAGVGITALSATVVAGVVATTKAVAESVDPLAKYARDMGLAFETLGDLVHVNGLFGISQQQTQQSLTKTSKFLGEVQRGMSEQVKTLDALGLSYDDLADKDVAGQQKELLRALADVEDMALRNSYAMQIFGRSGTQFAGLSQQFDAYTKSLEDFESQNLSMTTAQAEKLEAFNDAYSNMEVRLKSVTGVMSSEFAPALTQVFDVASAAFDTIMEDQELMDKLFGNVSESLNNISFNDVLTGLSKVAIGIGKGVDFANDLMKAFKLIGTTVIAPLQATIEKFVARYSRIRKIFADDEDKQFWQDQIDEYNYDFSQAFDDIKKDAKNLIDGSTAGKEFSDAITSAADIVLKKSLKTAEKIEEMTDIESIVSVVDEATDKEVAKQTAKENKVAFAGTAEALNSNYLTQSNEIAKRQLRELQKISKRKPQQVNYTMVSI